MLSKVLPKFEVGQIDICDLSRDADVCTAKAALASEFGDNGGVSALTVVSMMKAQKRTRPKLSLIQCPTLVATGTEDRMCDQEGSINAATAISYRFDKSDFLLVTLLISEFLKSTTKLTTCCTMNWRLQQPSFLTI